MMPGASLGCLHHPTFRGKRGQQLKMGPFRPHSVRPLPSWENWERQHKKGRLLSQAAFSDKFLLTAVLPG